MKRNHQKFARNLSITLMTLTLSASTLLASDYSNHWAKEAITRWNQYSIVKGYEDGSFKPSNPITRAELATILSNLMGLTETAHNRVYQDIKEGQWYTEAIDKISAEGLMYIPTQDFKPNQLVTREEAAYALAKAYEMPIATQPSEFLDQESISAWAKDSIDALAERGIIKGFEGKFKPQDSITRAEIVTMINNMTPNYFPQAGIYTQVVPGNVVITAPGITLKDVTIQGDLYICPSVAEGTTQLDNVTVTGTVYIQGGQALLNGKFNQIELASGKAFELRSGSISQLTTTKAGSEIYLHSGTVTEHLFLAEEAQLKGEGKINKKTYLNANAIIESAGVYIGGELIEVEVEGNEITIDLAKLGKENQKNDRMESLIINTPLAEAYLLGPTGGQMKTNVAYSFRVANRELGIFQEMLDQIADESSEAENLIHSMGVTGESVFDMIGLGNSISIADLRDQYNNLRNLAVSITGSLAPDSYSFTRKLYSKENKPIDIVITVIINH